MNDGFVFVDELVTGIRWDAKYATWDNFTGKPVDGYAANRIVGTTALCAALERAREEAASLGFGLLLWDGYRPQRAVDCFLRWAKQPEDGRTKRRHYPNISKAELFEKGYVAARSSHTRGSTVDLTLYRLATGELAPMGGEYDLMDAVSHHEATGLTHVEAANRRCLRSIMTTCGFGSYDCEWWHYTLEDEPYPDSYFDFPIVRDCVSERQCEVLGDAGRGMFSSVTSGQAVDERRQLVAVAVAPQLGGLRLRLAWQASGARQIRHTRGVWRTTTLSFVSAERGRRACRAGAR